MGAVSTAAFRAANTNSGVLSSGRGVGRMQLVESKMNTVPSRHSSRPLLQRARLFGPVKFSNLHVVFVT